MMLFKLVLLIYYFWIVRAKDISESNSDIEKFPDDLEFGASTAAYQIEGGWMEDGRGPTIWDSYTHDHPEYIIDGSNGDVGPDSYHYYEEDIKALKSIGVDYYRFSISWTRILPNGDTTKINELGIKYYNTLIDKLLENGIKPMVTMNHYDIPDAFQKKFGGPTNEVFVRYFEAYANVLFERFGDRVKRWITFNEPYEFCQEGYGLLMKAPRVNGDGLSTYLCGHHILQAHALAYHLYKNHYQAKQNGKIGITINSAFYYSLINDTKAVDRAMNFRFGWFAHPIFSSKGGYPDVMVEQIKKHSLEEGLGWSRLPEFTEEWREKIKGSADFLGINYYTSRIIELRDKPDGPIPSWERDTMLQYSINTEWKRGKSIWLYSVPTGIADLLRWIKREYNNPDVIITETGWSDDGQLDDYGRIEYIGSHLRELITCVNKNECNLKAYIVWSIIDNFEWQRGYTEKFGMFAVNLTSPQKERTPKASSAFFRKIIETRTIPNTYNRSLFTNLV